MYKDDLASAAGFVYHGIGRPEVLQPFSGRRSQAERVDIPVSIS
jgi:hypothetical protein